MTNEVPGEMGRESSHEQVGKPGAVSSDPAGLYCGNWQRGKPFSPPLLQAPSTCDLRDLNIGAFQLSAAASFKAWDQQGVG